MILWRFDRYVNETKWHPYFAWLPVICDNDVRWLETVLRRLNNDGGDGVYEYKAISKMGEQ